MGRQNQLVRRGGVAFDGFGVRQNRHQSVFGFVSTATFANGVVWGSGVQIAMNVNDADVILVNATGVKHNLNGRTDVFECGGGVSCA